MEKDDDDDEDDDKDDKDNDKDDDDDDEDKDGEDDDEDEFKPNLRCMRFHLSVKVGIPLIYREYASMENDTRYEQHGTRCERIVTFWTRLYAVYARKFYGPSDGGKFGLGNEFSLKSISGAMGRSVEKNTQIVKNILTAHELAALMMAPTSMFGCLIRSMVGPTVDTNRLTGALIRRIEDKYEVFPLALLTGAASEIYKHYAWYRLMPRRLATLEEASGYGSADAKSVSNLKQFAKMRKNLQIVLDMTPAKVCCRQLRVLTTTHV